MKTETNRLAAKKPSKTRKPNRKRKAREEWSKPLSQKAYKKISDKAMSLLNDFGVGSLRRQLYVMQYVDVYLLHNVLPKCDECEFYIFAVLTCLKYDIDAAKERSAAARRHAAARRERKKRELAEQPGATPSLPDNDRAGTTEISGEECPAVAAESQAHCDGAVIGVGDDELCPAVEGGNGERAAVLAGSGTLDAPESRVTVAGAEQTDSAGGFAGGVPDRFTGTLPGGSRSGVGRR